MKRFAEYLMEAKEEAKYCFKIKVAGPVPEHCEDAMKAALQKFSVANFSKTKTTPIQSKLVDFPEMENAEVTIYEADVEYPTTSFVIANLIAEHTGIPSNRVRVRSSKEEEEAELNAENCQADPSGESVLTQDYEKENNQNVVGDKGVSNFLKELAKVRKEHEPQQYKGVNDAILAKKSPSEKAPKAEKAPAAKSPISGKGK